MEGELVTLDEKSIIGNYEAGKNFDLAVENARAVVTGFKHDMSTVTTRKKTASLAAKVARFKTRLDNYGKEVISDQQSQINTVNGIRKKMRDELDALKKVARAPLDNWQALEDARIDSIKRQIISIKILSDPDDGVNYFSVEQLKENLETLESLVIHDAFAEFTVEAEHVKAESIDRLKNIISVETERAAEAAELGRLRAEAEENERRQAAEKTERDQAERDERIKKEAAEQATRKAEAKAQQEIDDLKAGEAVRKDQAARKKAANDKRKADTAITDNVNAEVIGALSQFTDRVTAKLILNGIILGKIPNVTINY